LRSRAVEGRPGLPRGEVRLVPLRFGTKAIGLLAAAGRPIEPATLHALAGLAALALERVHFLDERKSAELTRQGEELKSALLASLSHDLRTPLTAIRVAADNLQSSWADQRERREQSELIVTEVDRLTRLFENILEMARIDAGAVTTDARWVAPSEIVDAARSRVEHALRSRTLELSVESDRLVRLDPRLPAAALSHLLENAAQYSPQRSSIQLHGSVTDTGLTITVRDHGAGIAAGDLPHVFERFYRGADAKAGRSGTGMGLAIARGILVVNGGRITAENCEGGGARFTIAVPAANMRRRMKETASVERHDQVGVADDASVSPVNALRVSVLLVNQRKNRCRPPMNVQRLMVPRQATGRSMVKLGSVRRGK